MKLLKKLVLQKVINKKSINYLVANSRELR